MVQFAWIYRVENNHQDGVEVPQHRLNAISMAFETHWKDLNYVRCGLARCGSPVDTVADQWRHARCDPLHYIGHMFCEMFDDCRCEPN
jgi:hypothetical protein